LRSDDAERSNISALLTGDPTTRLHAAADLTHVVRAALGDCDLEMF
jgi:hypothetical protein